MQKFSHIFEVGMLEFYRCNYIACLGVWIPIVEGVIRSFLGVTFGRIVRDDLKNLRAKSIEEQQFLDKIVECILQYLSETFFKNVNGIADLSSNNFNRHFFSHSISSEPLYCQENCLKLLNIFDSFLAIDFIINEGFKALFDGTDEKIKIREAYYLEMVRDAFSDFNLLKLELLKDHRYFDQDFYFSQPQHEE